MDQVSKLPSILTVNMLLSSILHLDESRSKKALTSLRKGMSKLVELGKIPKEAEIELRMRMKNIKGVQNMQSIFISPEKLKTEIDKHGLLKNDKWTMLILFLFRMVPEGKYIAKQFFINYITENWEGELYTSPPFSELHPTNSKKRIARSLSHPFMQTLGRLAREGYLERERINEYVQLYGKEKGRQKKIDFAKTKVHGPIKIIGSGQNQSAFMLTEKGKQYIIDFLEIQCIEGN